MELRRIGITLRIGNLEISSIFSTELLAFNIDIYIFAIQAMHFYSCGIGVNIRKGECLRAGNRRVSCFINCRTGRNRSFHRLPSLIGQILLRNRYSSVAAHCNRKAACAQVGYINVSGAALKSNFFCLGSKSHLCTIAKGTAGNFDRRNRSGNTRKGFIRSLAVTFSAALCQLDSVGSIGSFKRTVCDLHGSVLDADQVPVDTVFLSAFCSCKGTVINDKLLAVRQVHKRRIRVILRGVACKGAACQGKMELRRVLFILCISHYKSVLFCEILTIDGDINVFPIQFARTHGSCILRNAVVRIFWCCFLGKGADWNQHKHHRSRSQCRKPLFLSQNKKPPSFFSKEIQSPV